MDLSIVDLGPVPPAGTAAESFANSIELARIAEQLGYARYWITEHHGVGHVVANSVPEVLVGCLAAATTSIRVGSGGVLINYTSPLKVAETFRVLHALHPDRIDLGMGRANAPGVVDLALGSATARLGDAGFDNGSSMLAWLTHEDQLTEVIAWLDAAFPAGHPFADVALLPGVAGGPEPWLLGASVASAVLAARLGLRYCYAAFLDPSGATSALQLYRQSFQPSPLPSACAAPRSMLALHIACADTDDDADRLRASADLFHDRRATDGSGLGPLLDADSAIAELGGPPEPSVVERGRWPARISGSPARVASIVEEVVTVTGADEVIVQDLIPRHEDRVRSYELLAGVFDLAAAASTNGVTTR